MKFFSKIIFLVLLPVFLIFSCRKRKCDEKIPAIAFKEFRQYYNSQGKPIDDSAKIIITFKDCDGDIGLDEKDSVTPYDFNFELKYFEMVNGSWKGCQNKTDSCFLVQINQNIQKRNGYFSFKIPMLTPKGQSKILEGEIGMTIAPLYFIPSPDSDTIKYEVQLFDRALNGSNIIETPMIFTK